jgi:hypothetical protein
MKVIHKAYLKAVDSTLFFLDDSPTMVAKLPIATPTINSLKSKTQTLYGIDSQLQSLNQLSAFSKTKQRKALTELCLEIAAKGRAYAIHNENEALGQILNTKISVLGALGDTIFRDRAQMIKNTVEAEIANIDAAIFHLTAADLTAFQAKIDAYTQAIPGPNSRINQIKALNANFELLLTETKAVAKKLDALVDTIRFKEAVFYTQYYAVRKPKKVSSQPRALVITILDKTTNLPIAKASVSLTGQTTGKNLMLTANKNGVIAINNLTEDIYEGSASQTSYFSADYTLPIIDGKTYKKTILLEANPDNDRDARG